MCRHLLAWRGSVIQRVTRETFQRKDSSCQQPGYLLVLSDLTTFLQFSEGKIMVHVKKQKTGKRKNLRDNRKERKAFCTINTRDAPGDVVFQRSLNKERRKERCEETAQLLLGVLPVPR